MSVYSEAHHSVLNGTYFLGNELTVKPLPWSKTLKMVCYRSSAADND